MHDIDPETGNSRFAIHPDGHLIKLGRGQALKAGFRYATSDDVIHATSAQPVAPTRASDFDFSDEKPSDRD